MENLQKIQDIIQWDEKECEHFLTQNFGLLGISKTGITKDKNNRTLDNMRIECINQFIHTINPNFNL